MKTAIVIGAFGCGNKGDDAILDGLRAGVAFVAVIYDEKVRHLLQRIGMENYCMELDEIGTDRLEQIIDRISRNYDILKSGLLQTSSNLGNLARENIENLFLGQ